MSMHYRVHRVRWLTVVLIAVIIALLAALGGGTYLYLTQSQQKEVLQAQYAVLTKQKEALQEELARLQEQSDALSAEQQLQIDALSQTLADTQQALEDLDNTVAELNISLGGEIGSAPVYFSKPICEENAKLIALTFDDGPSAKYTPALLDGLKERGVRATFFVVGDSVKGNEELLKRIHNEGHVIGNHTMNHKNLAEEEPDVVREQLNGCADLVESIIGVRPSIARMPGGKLDEETRTVLAELGLPAIGWSVDTRDWESRDVEKILGEAFKKGQYGVRDGAIVLMHDRIEATTQAALEIVDRLLEEGYTFVTVPELLAARKPLVLTGAVYSSAFPTS